MSLPVSPEQICRDLRPRIETIKRGSLRIWGDWFGRPMDNWHQITGCEAEGDRLTFIFEGGEQLDVWNPQDVAIDHARFAVGRATRVRWRWFWYGAEQTPETLRTLDYTLESGLVRLKNDVGYRPALQTFAPSGAAAELL